jgi:serine/threonine protein kinase
MHPASTCRSGHPWESTTPEEICPYCAAADEFANKDTSLDSEIPADELPPPPLQSLAPFVPVVTKSAAARGWPDVAGYAMLAELGRGGMGVVYKARDLRLNRIVALKMIRAGADASVVDLARFRTEAEATARLQHPNIVQVFEVGEADGLPYVALEFVAGSSLSAQLRDGPLESRVAAALVESLADAMQYAHQNGIVHRDLKPANILISAGGGSRSVGTTIKEGDGVAPPAPSGKSPSPTAKITDFGLARRLDVPGQTKTGEILGTPSYMAPEQASGMSLHVGPAADIYALGAILYECLTGRPPFLASFAAATLLQVLSDEPVPPSRLARGVQRDLETICLKCLHKEPRRRYPTAQALADDLRRFQKGEAITARPIGPIGRSWRWCRRNPAVATLLTIAVLFLLGGSAVSLYFAFQSAHRADQAKSNEERALANEQKEITARKETERTLVEGLLLPLGRTEHPTPAEIEALSKLAAFPRDDVRVLFVETALGDLPTMLAFSRRADEATHAAIGLSPERRDRVAALLLERIRSLPHGDERTACIRAAAALRCRDAQLARAVVADALEVIPDLPGKVIAAPAIAIDDLTLLIGHLSASDRDELLALGRTRFLDASGERRFVILAAFLKALPADAANQLARDLAERLEATLDALTEKHDIAILERAVRMLAEHLGGEDALNLADAIAECAARKDLAPEARNNAARRRTLARMLIQLSPRLPAEERPNLARQMLALLVPHSAEVTIASEETEWARIRLALASTLPDEEKKKALAVVKRVADLFKESFGLRQNLLPTADFLIDVRAHLASADAKRVAQELYKAIQNPNRDPHSFHAATAALSAYRDQLTARELDDVISIVGGRKPAVPISQVSSTAGSVSPIQSSRTAEQADLLAASAAFCDRFTEVKLETLRTVLIGLVNEASQQENPRLRIALVRALILLGPKMPSHERAQIATDLAHALLRERDGLSTANNYQRTDEGDQVRDAFGRLLPLFSEQKLIDLMKQPLCRRVEREQIARELGRRHGLAFKTTWDCAEWVEAQRPELDLTSPPAPFGSRR